MSRTANVVRLTLPPERRVLVISDIHGNLPFFKGVLSAARYTPDDVLVLLGDLVEKGPDSLATLRYIMALAERNTVYCVRGNCDNLVSDFALDEGAPEAGFYHHYLNVWRDRCLLVQMGQAAGFETRGPEDLAGLREVVRERFAPELAFLEAMPEILVTPDYLFVHGGVADEERLDGLDAWGCMKNDDFLSQGHAFRRWCIVGHWPVTLYDPRVPRCRPLLEERRHIASIDGGCSLQIGGQLNALVLPEAPGGAFSWFAYDGLPTAAALDAQAPSADSVNVRWGRNALEVLERGRELSRCRHLETGRVLDVLTGTCTWTGESPGARTPPTTGWRCAPATPCRWCGASPTGSGEEDGVTAGWITAKSGAGLWPAPPCFTGRQGAPAPCPARSRGQSPPAPPQSGDEPGL